MPVPPTLRSFDLNLLVLFDALYRERKLSAAARAVGLSQPAASQALGRLRDAFDDPLFVRQGQGMEPTAQAHALAPAVQDALGSLRRRLGAMRSFDAAKSDREFRIGFAELGEAALLPALVAALTDEAPSIRLRAVVGAGRALLAAAAKRSADLGLDFEAPGHDAFRHARLTDAEMVVIARRDHPRVRGSLSEDQLFTERHVGVALDEEQHHRLLDVLGRDLDPSSCAATVSTFASIPHVVLATDAIAIVPRFVARRALGEGSVQALEPAFRLAPLPLYLYWEEGFESDPGHAWMRERVALEVGRVVSDARV